MWLVTTHYHIDSYTETQRFRGCWYGSELKTEVCRVWLVTTHYLIVSHTEK